MRKGELWPHDNRTSKKNELLFVFIFRNVRESRMNSYNCTRVHVIITQRKKKRV